MKHFKILVSISVLAAAGCAERPAYFGTAARVTQQNGAAYWESPAMSPAYMRVRMLKPQSAARATPAVYEGTLTIRSISPAVMQSSFTVAEGSSATFHYDLNTRATAVRYEPGALDVVVACSRGECRASATPAPIWDDGSVLLKLKKKSPRRRVEKRQASRKAAADAGALAAAADLRKDADCAALDQTVTAASTRMSRTGEAETRTEREARGRYLAQGCPAWLDGHGGAAAARRRVRLSGWTSLDGQ